VTPEELYRMECDKRNCHLPTPKERHRAATRLRGTVCHKCRSIDVCLSVGKRIPRPRKGQWLHCNACGHEWRYGGMGDLRLGQSIMTVRG
jgi:hypothetical protein